MADPKDPKDPSAKTPPAETDILRDLQDLRRGTVTVTEKEQERWREEASRARDPKAAAAKMAAAKAAEPEPEPEKEPEVIPRWEKIRRAEQKRKIAGIVLGVICVGCLFHPKVRGLFHRPSTTSSSPAVKASVQSATASEGPASIAEAYLVCRLEVNWARPRILEQSLRSDPESVRDWPGLPGPAAILGAPRTRDPLERYFQIVPTSVTSARYTDVDELAKFIRQSTDPDTLLLADSLLANTPELPARARSLVTGKSSYQGALAAGVITLDSDGPSSEAIADLERALTGAPTGDPWPAWALALVATSVGSADKAVAPVESWTQAHPGSELASYALGFLLLHTQKYEQLDKFLTGLGTGAASGQSLLLRGTLAASQHNWAELKKHLDGMEPLLAKESAEVRARYLQLKALYLLTSDSDQRNLIQDSLQQSFDLDRKVQWLELSLARQLSKNRFRDESLVSYGRYLHRYPGADTIRREMAQVLMDEKQYAPALAQLQILACAVPPAPQDIQSFTKAATELNRPDLVEFVAAKKK